MDFFQVAFVQEEDTVYDFVYFTEIVVCQYYAPCPCTFCNMHTYFFGRNGGKAVERFVQQDIRSFAV